MYDINDNISAIKTLELYLGKIYQDEISINQNGNFDDLTKMALNRFQSENGLMQKSYADFESYRAIYKAYQEKIEQDNARKIAPDIIFPIKRGDQSSAVLKFNSMLKEILEFYSNYSFIPQSDYFSEETEEAVRILQNVFDFEINGIANDIFYSRLVKEWKSINKIKSY